MTVGNSGTNGQRENNDQATTPEHSQTLPLITEEVVSSHPVAAAEPTEHVANRVMPPNPIRHDHESTRQAAQTVSTTTAASSATAAPTAVSPTAVAEAAETAEDKKKEEKSSEGRISATQLLAGAGAAATSSVIGGQLGVAGTVVGAGVASIVSALAVTLYGRSLEKGKEKIQEVGSKLAPAVKAKIAKAPDAAGSTDVDPSLAEDSAFAPPEPGGVDVNRAAASAGDGTDEPTADDDEPQKWWQKLRRKRVLYPVTIGVAAFGIGLGAVVVAENFTDADISPGTSQISRTVSGQSTTDETDTTDGSSDSGTGGEGSSSGSGSNGNGSQGSTTGGSNTQNGQSTSAGETGTEGASQGQSSQGTDTTTGTSDSSASTGTDGTDTSTGSTSADGTGSTGDTSGTSGSGAGSSGSGGSSSGGSGSGSSGAGGTGSGGSASSAQG